MGPEGSDSPGDHEAEAGRSRSKGFLRAAGAAVALDLVAMPIAVVVASLPFLKLITRPAIRPSR
jgi:hypothetical protein